VVPLSDLEKSLFCLLRNELESFNQSWPPLALSQNDRSHVKELPTLSVLCLFVCLFVCLVVWLVVCVTLVQLYLRRLHDAVLVALRIVAVYKYPRGYVHNDWVFNLSLINQNLSQAKSPLLVYVCK
jgi:uncharacterized membrane protein YhaH (DUF805 family)